MEAYEYNSGTFVGKGGVEIFFQSWNVKKPRVVLFIAHGLGEHSGRYMNIIKKLQGKGVSVFSMDHRGHGRSGGKPGHVDAFSEYISDLNLYINCIKMEHEKIPFILMGHSMGGLIACKYTLSHSSDVDGLILSAPAFILAVEVPGWKTGLGKFFSRYIPGLTMSNELDPKLLSHDENVVKTYTNDPFVHNKVTARFYTEFIAAGAECIARTGELTIPLLIFHGEEDKMVSPRGSEIVYAKASTEGKRKALHIYPGLFHETMNETLKERNRVLDTVVMWIETQTVALKHKSHKTSPAVKKKHLVKKNRAVTKPSTSKRAGKKK